MACYLPVKYTLCVVKCDLIQVHRIVIRPYRVYHFVGIQFSFYCMTSLELWSFLIDDQEARRDNEFIFCKKWALEGIHYNEASIISKASCSFIDVTNGGCNLEEVLRGGVIKIYGWLNLLVRIL